MFTTELLKQVPGISLTTFLVFVGVFKIELPFTWKGNFSPSQPIIRTLKQ